MERIDQSCNGISWNPMMESENNGQFLPSYSTQNELYVDDSASETDMISPMSDMCPSFPQLPHMPYHRSPPGFVPLIRNHSASFTHESFKTEAVEQSEVKNDWFFGSQG